MEQIYRGIIRERGHGENDDALYIGGTLIAEAVEADMEDWGRYLSVRYMVSDEPFAVEDFEPRIALFGEGFAEYRDAYSDITGYLWTDENLQVGGHDLDAELRSYAGKFCHLEIRYSQTPQEPTP